MAEKEKKKKIVRATDASLLNRLRKKLGVNFLEDMTDKELQAVLDAPDSVFGKMKRQGNVGYERARRKALTEKAYKDKILRTAKKNSKGSNDMRKGGMVISTVDNRKNK